MRAVLKFVVEALKKGTNNNDINPILLNPNMVDVSPRDVIRRNRKVARIAATMISGLFADPTYVVFDTNAFCREYKLYSILVAPY